MRAVSFKSTAMKDEGDYIEMSDIKNGIKKLTNLRDVVLLTIMSETGARIGEILELKKSDINFAKRELYIKTFKQEGHPIRMIPLNNRTTELLRRYTRMKRIKLNKYRKKKTDKLFPITKQRAWQIVRSFSDRFKIRCVNGKKNIHPHSFRHSFAVHYVKNGGNIRSLQKILGHKDLTITASYLRLVENDVKEDFKKVME